MLIVNALCMAYMYLLLRFFVGRMLAAPTAELGKLQLAFYLLFILMRPVRNAFALGTLKLYEKILRHVPKNNEC